MYTFVCSWWCVMFGQVSHGRAWACASGSKNDDDANVLPHTHDVRTHTPQLYTSTKYVHSHPWCMHTRYHFAYTHDVCTDAPRLYTSTMYVHLHPPCMCTHIMYVTHTQRFLLISIIPQSIIVLHMNDTIFSIVCSFQSVKSHFCADSADAIHVCVFVWLSSCV